MESGAVALTCEWKYGRFTNDTELGQNARLMYAALADCIQPGLANAERDDAGLELRGNLQAARSLALSVTTHNSSDGPSLSLRVLVTRQGEGPPNSMSIEHASRSRGHRLDSRPRPTAVRTHWKSTVPLLADCSVHRRQRTR